MLSPATPLTLALLIAFALLLLTTISVPVVKSIPLGNYGDVNYGVLGSCYTNGSRCTAPNVGYNTSTLWPSGEAPIHLSSSSRSKLSYILIVHPVAAFLILICTILAGTAHLPAAGHNPQYLLGLLILTFPTLLVTLLAFLVDILLFVPPHMQWGGWIVLPAVLIITACSVVTCAMRRTLVSRIARKERIEKNEDMNGSTYYQMKADTSFRPLEPQYRAPDGQFARAESPPPLESSQPLDDGTKMAQFNTFDRPSMDERSPMTAREPSIHTTGSGLRRRGDLSGSTMAGSGFDSDGQYGAAQFDDYGNPRRSSESRRRAPRAPPGPYGRGGPPMPGYSRSRGGYPPPRGPRGGYNSPRGSYSRGGGAPGGRGPPPPGWSGYGRGGPAMGRGRPGPPPGYPNGYARGPPPPEMGPDGMIMYPNPRGRSNSPHVRSPIDQPSSPWSAREDGYSQQHPIDWESNKTPYQDPLPSVTAPFIDDYGEGDAVVDNTVPAYDTRPSTGNSITRDPASFGFSGRQPSPASRNLPAATSSSPPPPLPQLPSSDTFPGQAIALDASTGSPAGTPSAAQSGWQPPSAEVDDHRGSQSHLTNQPDTQDAASHVSIKSRGRPSTDTYYEDVDPRFSQDVERSPLPATSAIGSPPPLPHFEFDEASEHHMSSALMPRGYESGNPPQNPNTLYPNDPAPRENSHSPALSDEGSNFTSISQRGVNPQWQPEPGSPSNNMSTYAPPRWREQERILNANPDFIVPGAGPSRHSRARGMSGPTSGGRYPDAV